MATGGNPEASGDLSGHAGGRPRATIGVIHNYYEAGAPAETRADDSRDAQGYGPNRVTERAGFDEKDVNRISSMNKDNAGRPDNRSQRVEARDWRPSLRKQEAPFGSGYVPAREPPRNPGQRAREPPRDQDHLGYEKAKWFQLQVKVNLNGYIQIWELLE